ncbi:MAG: hypothetical protein QXK54_06150 [Ignisphaera sp.]
MMSQDLSSKEDPVHELANIGRIVVHVEYAYDIVDEMASNPEKYIDSLYKLSRLVVKVQKDLIKNRELFEEGTKNKVYEYVMNGLQRWALKVKEFADYISSLSDDRKREEEIKRLALLLISPDTYSLIVRDTLERTGGIE